MKYSPYIYTPDRTHAYARTTRSEAISQFRGVRAKAFGTHRLKLLISYNCIFCSCSGRTAGCYLRKIYKFKHT